MEYDDDLGARIANQFRHWMDSLEFSSSLAVARYLAKDSFQQIDLHLFCDASEMAYGAAIYARITSDTGILTSLLAANSRLASRKTVCIPKLELYSMVLGCKLLKWVLKLIQTLQLVVDISAWSDSTETHAWIRSSLNRYFTFKANRIANVQQMLPADKWKPVPPHKNPTDHTTRPVPAAELQNLQLRWSEPSWWQKWSFYSVKNNNSRSKWIERAQTVIRRNHTVHSGSWWGGNHASSKCEQD